MSCNCPDTNKCPDTQQCLCGVNLNIYNSNGVLVETVKANIFEGVNGIYYQADDSTAFNSVLPAGYVLIISYNSLSQRWEMSYYDETLMSDIVIGVLYGVNQNECPSDGCWDLDCISFIFQPRLTKWIITWNGEYLNGRKKYTGTFPVDSGPPFDWVFYWDSISNRWNIERDPGTPFNWAYYISNSICIPTEVTWLNTLSGSSSEYQTFPLGVTGFDMTIDPIDCGCCNTEVNISIDGQTYSAQVEYDEYGNILGYNGITYYTFTIGESIYYLFYLNGEWVVKGSLSLTEPTLAKSTSTNECPYGIYKSELFKSVYVIGTECFDCCDYDTPKNRNLLKKKKAIFVKEISSIRSKEIFGLKCGTEWDDLFRKHLIFDVLWCLPYGKICDEEQQCLINNLNDNCNC